MQDFLSRLKIPVYPQTLNFILLSRYNGKGTNQIETDLILFFIEVKEMELAEIRNELEKTAKKLADFRGSL